MSWEGGKAAEYPTDSPINWWSCPWPPVFNSWPAQDHVSGAPGLGHTVHCEELGLRCWYARRIGGGWIGSWKDFHLSGSSIDMQTTDCESCDGVTTVDCVGEYHCTVGEHSTKQLFRGYQCRTEMVSIGQTLFRALPFHRDWAHFTTGASSTYICPWTNAGGDNAKSCRDCQECYRQDDICNPFQTDSFATHGKCEWHPQRSEHES